MSTGVITLTRTQHERLDVVNKTCAGFITVKEAAEQLGMSERQIQRIKKAVKQDGPAALVHKNTNRKPGHALQESTKEAILEYRVKAGYKDSNFKHFQELLEMRHGISISYSALSRLLKDNNIFSPKKRRRFKPHRRRKRREQSGLLVQMDASSYDWLGVGNPLALHGAIDDATGQVTGLFLCKNECMLGYFETMRRMINVFGSPVAIYADRHTIFRSPNADKAGAIDTPKELKAHQTQFGRALSELGIRIIAARSPQAKGRVERLWGTLQSRLPIEFTLNGIEDIDAANDFLSTYVFAFNSEFALEPHDSDSAFLPLEKGVLLDNILCVKEERILDSGYVFSYSGKLFQLADSTYTSYIPPKAKVTVMISPRLGIKAAYRQYLFDTNPVKHKSPKPTKAPRKPVDDAPRVYRAQSAWTPKDGLPWEPGQPSYREMFEIVSTILTRPYSGAKKRSSPDAAS